MPLRSSPRLGLSMMREAETMLANFKGRQSVTLKEARERCGFSAHEAFAALSSLKRDGLATGYFEWGGTASFNNVNNIQENPQ